MPPEGQLISLQHRLMRAARAYLDPELQAGTITPDQAFKVLTDDVVLSEAMARQEVDRYTFRAPGQATSYFYGYTRLVELRADVEKAAGRVVRPAGVPRLHPRAGTAAARADARSGARAVRQEMIRERRGYRLLKNPAALKVE